MKEPFKELEGFYAECRSTAVPPVAVRQVRTTEYGSIARCLAGLAAGVALTVAVATGAGSGQPTAPAADVSWLLRRQFEVNGLAPPAAQPLLPRHTETRSWHA